MVASDNRFGSLGLLNAGGNGFLLAFLAQYGALDTLYPHLGLLVVQQPGHIFAYDVVFAQVNAFGILHSGLFTQTGVQIF